MIFLFIAKSLKKTAAANGFIHRRGTYFRRKNDLVQGFHVGKQIEFAIYPLCDPFSNLYRYSFEGRPLYFLTRDISAAGLSKEEQLQKILFPYFEEYTSCEICSKGLPELDGMIATTQQVFFALKCNDVDHAIELLRGLMLQRKMAYMRNVEVFGVEKMNQQAERIKEKNKRDEEFISFLQSAETCELTSYLGKNEEQAIQFLFG